MSFNENLISFRNAKKMLDAFVANGGDVNNLKKGDREYEYIKNIRTIDEKGMYIDLETRFAMLNHPRQRKYSSNIKQSLIDEVVEFKSKGGSFHILRKNLPFYERLNTYTRHLRKTNPNITYEQVMKDLGFKDYSDIYFRCIDLSNLDKYEDANDFVDSYRTNPKMKAYVTDLAKTLNLPYYIVITLLCDKKLKKCSMLTEYVELVKHQLTNHLKTYGTLTGLRRKDASLYEKFQLLVKYYSDGSENRFSKEEWLEFFGFEDVENEFENVKTNSVDIDGIMFDLKEQFGKATIKLKDLDRKTYRKIVKKAIGLGVAVDEVFAMYGLKCNGVKIDRLSKVYTNNIPYLNEILKRRDELMQKIDTKNMCKEEIFEHKVKVVKIVYEEFKDKIYNFNQETVEEQL